MSDKSKKSIFKRWWFWALIVVVIIIIASAAGKGGGDKQASTTTPAADSAAQQPQQSDPAPAQEQQKATKTIEYRVEGTGKATSVTFMTIDKGQVAQSQEMDAKLPWSKTVEVSTDELLNYQSATLTAQNGAASGTITGVILVDGKEVARNSSSGQYAVVTVNGNIN